MSDDDLDTVITRTAGLLLHHDPESSAGTDITHLSSMSERLLLAFYGFVKHARFKPKCVILSLHP